MCGDLVIKPETNVERHCSMMDFLSQELEQSRMCQHHTFVFCDVDCQLLPETFLEKVAKSRVCAIIGPVVGDADEAGMGVAEWSRKYVIKGKSDEEASGEMEEEAEEKKLQGATPKEVLNKEREKDEMGSDIDSDGYNMVDDDSNVMVMSTISAKVISLEEEMNWKIKQLEV